MRSVFTPLLARARMGARVLIQVSSLSAAWPNSVPGWVRAGLKLSCFVRARASSLTTAAGAHRARARPTARRTRALAGVEAGIEAPTTMRVLLINGEPHIDAIDAIRLLPAFVTRTCRAVHEARCEHGAFRLG
jgi:hypothetical protein